LDKNADARLPAPTKAALAPLAMKLAEESLARDRYPAAERLAKAARLMSAGRDSEVAKSAQELLDRLPRLTKDYAQLKKAEEALAAHPNDPAANLAAGKIHCFSRNTEESWNLGLSLLIKGSDPVLKIVAEAELAVDPATAEPADAVRLGDLWFDAATGASEDVRADCRRRAIHWYQQALPGLQGFNRAKITRRLEDLGASSARETEPKTEEKPAPKSTAKAEGRRGAGAAAEESSGKPPPPKAALLNPAIQRIRSQYKEQLAKGASVDVKRQLIRDLYKSAESTQDPATQFAMLQTSRDVAVELGNPDWFDPIIGAMNSRFTIDILKMKIECMKLAWQSPSAKTYQKPLTDYSRQLLDDAIEQKDRVAAEQALVVLVAAARATNNSQLLKELEDKVRQANPAAAKGRK
jgi:hypothetical protein